MTNQPQEGYLKDTPIAKGTMVVVVVVVTLGRSSTFQ